MSKFEWTDELRADIKELDDQHKKVIDLFNSILKAKDNNQEQELIDGINELITFWKIHFNYEEELMEKYEYEELTDHTAEHEEILKNMRNLEQMYSNGFDDVVSCLKLLLNQWIEVHIASEDKKLGEFLSNKGVT